MWPSLPPRHINIKTKALKNSHLNPCPPPTCFNIIFFYLLFVDHTWFPFLSGPPEKGKRNTSSLWSGLLLKVILRSMACAATGDHVKVCVGGCVDVCGPCCGQKSRGGPRSVLPLAFMGKDASFAVILKTCALLFQNSRAHIRHIL